MFPSFKNMLPVESLAQLLMELKKAKRNLKIEGKQTVK